MKSLFLSLFILFNFQVLGNDLTQTESDRLSEDLDNICGDTWCEGDFNWYVDNFKCSLEKKTCSVDLTLRDEFYFDDEYGATREEFVTKLDVVSKVLNVDVESDVDYSSITYQQTCTLTGMDSREVVFDQTGYTSYSDEVYFQVLDCVTEIEEAYWEAAGEL